MFEQKYNIICFKFIKVRKHAILDIINNEYKNKELKMIEFIINNRLKI